MSLKQKDHRNHYVSALGELPEVETVPSDTTPIENLGISLVDEEAKTLDSEGEDDVTPEEMKIQFFSLIANLQRQYPSYSATDFKKFLEEDVGMTEQLKVIKNNFHETFQDVVKTDPEYINMLIGMSSIGIEIFKDSEDEGDGEGEAEAETTDV